MVSTSLINLVCGYPSLFDIIMFCCNFIRLGCSLVPFQEMFLGVCVKSWIFCAFVLDDVKYKLLHLQGGKAFSKLVTLASLSSHREIQYNSAGTLGQLALVSE